MSTGSLDTNVLARLLLKDNLRQHEAAVNLLSDTKGQFSVADTAFIELAFILERHYKLSRADIQKGFEVLLSMTILNFNRTLIRKAMPQFLKSAALSFEDCCLAAYAELNSATPLWTFDKKLAGQAPGAKLLA